MHSSCRYTGNEPSPKGLGFCAHYQAEGAIKRGADGKMWIVSADRNGRLSWKRLSSSSSRTKRMPTSTIKKRWVTDMAQATSVLKKLRLNRAAFENEFDSNVPLKGRTYFYPDKKLRVKLAVPGGAKSKKGYLIGQGVFSNRLGIVADDRFTGAKWSLTKSDKYLYPYMGYLGTGSGADPAFKVL